MATEPSTKAKAWAIFDRIVGDAAPNGVHTNPWMRDESREISYMPDYTTLTRLLGVPLALEAKTTTGVPALALDVWVAYELRRAGFEPDRVWPRPTAPRVLPAPVSALLSKVTKPEREALWKRLTRGTPPAGAAASQANILGKNYVKQVDVVISNWDTGPELLVSTKRMDSSFGKNAANRVEESYGDAKNLRLRHPLAALGFMYGLRTTIMQESPDKAAWLIDLLQKLGREDDAYHAVVLLMIEYGEDVAVDDDGADGDGDALVDAGIVENVSDDENDAPIESDAVDDLIANLPGVVLRHDLVPENLSAGRFLSTMVGRVLDATPINFHTEARGRRSLID